MSREKAVRNWYAGSLLVNSAIICDVDKPMLLLTRREKQIFRTKRTLAVIFDLSNFEKLCILNFFLKKEKVQRVIT